MYLDKLYLITLVVNIMTCLLMGYDKLQAKKGGWRVPERNLILLAIMGGSTGIMVGMIVFRHKTRKPLFRMGIPAVLVLQYLILSNYLSYLFP